MAYARKAEGDPMEDFGKQLAAWMEEMEARMKALEAALVKLTEGTHG